MLQGTSSNAGKSVLTAALCRILLQDGFSVAPFKAQNMALNSFVTPDGCEIGRAQAVQAAACRLEPDTRMNPVLLKPSSDTGSQVIVLGKPVGNMRVKEYVRYKGTAFSTVKDAYDSLATEHDVLVLEGAGSPAEINLKAHDIVNMQMARYAKAKVLLVGDIDRGGVFASLVGTLELLDEWEKDLVVGLVLNRFRGDASLLDSALTFTTERTGKPFLGVVPHVVDLGLPEEDSVTFKEEFGRRVPQGDDTVDIALIDLPHIANFTDVDALTVEPDVSLRIVRRAEELGSPDAVIIPGSKNTLGDLQWLRAGGIAQALVACAEKEQPPVIVGICGGFQMLGRRVADPLGIESGDSAEGLGILPVVTEMGREKVLVRAEGTHIRSGESVYGYEIHHGKTVLERDTETTVCFRLRDGREAGVACEDSWGTYLHGVFDADGFRRHFIDSLRIRRGKEPLGIVATYSLEPALDRLAQVTREALNMSAIYAALGV